MAIQAPLSVVSVTSTHQVVPPQVQPKTKVNFEEVRNAVRGTGNDSLLGGDVHRDLMNLRTQIMNGKEISPQELLVYQIKASQFGLRVELISKLAESVVATSRKLQGNG